MRRTATALLLAAGLVGGALAAAAPVAAQSAGVVLRSGDRPETTPFPDDRFTVADERQLTGRRVALPTAGCQAQGAALCAQLALLNTLDGFDVRPRVSLPFTGPVDLRTITPQTVRVEGPDGFTTGLVELVLDPLSGTVTGQPQDYLAQGTTYSLVVRPGIRAADGSAVDVCATGCAAGATSRTVPFTTMTTTAVLDQVRAALDDGSAYAAARIPAEQRTIRFDTAQGGARSVFPASDSGTVLLRNDQVRADAQAQGAFTSTPVPNTAKTFAFYGFGSFTSPQYTGPDVRIPLTGSRTAPTPQRSDRLAVTMLSPAPSSSCIKPVVFGHGFTGSKYHLFLAADTLGESNLAVFATDVVGHGYGPSSTYTVVRGEQRTTGVALGRGRDTDGDGTIGNTEGVNATGAVSPLSSRDALIQTVIDNMVLVRALERGVDVDGNGTVDTCTGEGAVTYYGQSFGGIYGTMLLGTDPRVRAGVPNVPGGPITMISRLGAFRPLLGATLGAFTPDLRNDGPGLSGFTESLPLRRYPRVTDPVQGAVPVQEVLAHSTWLQRPGDPTSYAPRLRPGAQFGDKRVLVQVAYGDGTVPNPTSAEILRAGDLYDSTWVYRHDRTPFFETNPHSFLLIPTLPAHFEGQEQIRRFLGEGEERDPDTPQKPGWEPVVAKAGSAPTADYRLQLDCLHYPDPQTGQGQTRTQPYPDCTDRSDEVAPARPPVGTRYVALTEARRVLDTRDGTGTPRGRVQGTVTVDLRAVVPDAAATTAVLNVTALNSAGPGHVVVLPAGPRESGTSNLNLRRATAGQTAAAQANQVTARLDQERTVDLQVVGGPADLVVDVVGYTTGRETGGRYDVLAPTRVLDTRSTGQARRTGEVVVDLTGTPGEGASSVVLNVTVTAPTGRGHVVAFPTGEQAPETSNVNVEPGQTQANEVTVEVGSGNRVSLQVVGTSAAVIADLVAAVRQPASATDAQESLRELYPLQLPVRVGDTRLGGTGFGAAGTRSGTVDLTLPAAVPAGAGVVLNVTALGASAPAYVTVYPGGAAQPETSNVNVSPGQVQANEVVTGTGDGRTVRFLVGGRGAPRAHLVADLVAVLAPPSQATSAGLGLEAPAAG